MSLKEVLNSNRPAESRQLACALTFCGGFIVMHIHISREDIRFPLDKQETLSFLVQH